MANNFNSIIAETDRIFNCNSLSKIRKNRNVNGRVAISNYLRNYSNMTFHQISNILKKNHSSIIHYIKMHERFYTYDKQYKSNYDNLIELYPKPSNEQDQCIFIMKEKTTIDLQLYYGELMQMKENTSDFFELKRIAKKMKAIEILLNIDFI